MTACLYMSPYDQPVLIADVLVTGHMPTNRIVRPSSAVGGVEIQEISRTKLARKLHVLPERTAFCVSGYESEIQDFLLSVKPMINYLLQDDRPLKRVSDHVNGYGGKVQTIGIHMPKENSETVNLHKIHPTKSGFILPLLGHCAAIGSGALHLKELVEQILENSSKSLERTAVLGGPEEMIRGLVPAISSRIMLDDMEYGNRNRDFGGYIEYLFFDNKEKSWKYGPSSLHLFFMAKLVGDSVFDLFQVNRAILYEPGTYSGRILTLSVSEDSGFCYETLINNILESNSETYNDFDYWSEWFPASCTVTIFAEWGGKGSVTIKTLDWGEMEEILLAVRPERLQFGVTNKVLQKLVDHIEVAWGVRRVPSADGALGF